MNGVIGMANLLLAGPLTPEQRDLAGTLHQSGELLLSIINDILDFSKVDGGHLDLEQADFDPGEQIRNAIELQADAAHRKGLELVLDIAPGVPPLVRGDSTRLRQIILNLVGNAIKFTERGSVVVNVTAATDSRDRPLLRIEVSDTGIGIPASVQGTLFEPFVQADTSTTRRFGGTGLGLAICKRLVELMDGTIGVESQPGSGATFWFTVRLDRAESQSPPSECGAPASVLLPIRRALIVDDDAASRKFLERLLGAWGVSRDTVASGEEALRALRAAAAAGSAYDLVLFDHQMPGMDGLKLAAAIRSDASLPPATLVILSSRGERPPPAALSLHDIAACEPKPVRPDSLRTTLASALAPRIDLPMTPITTGTLVEQSATPNVSILVAEDNVVNQKVALMLLRKLGYSADVVSNGVDALGALRAKPYAVVLMDAHMPEMDGLEAARAIRAAQAAGDPAFPHSLQIIALTASAMPGDREACLAAGMDGYIAKPVVPQTLRDVLEYHLAAWRPVSSEVPECTLAG
ncbi:MAG TPA: response regulator, partial [Opitutaceae bacterium]